jgi:hypothetical protein
LVSGGEPANDEPDDVVGDHGRSCLTSKITGATPMLPGNHGANR